MVQNSKGHTPLVLIVINKTNAISCNKTIKMIEVGHLRKQLIEVLSFYHHTVSPHSTEQV